MLWNCNAFRANGVDKIYKLAQGLKISNTQRVYIVSHDISLCNSVFEQIESENLQKIGLVHHVLVVPFIPIAVSDLLEESGKNLKNCFSSEIVKLLQVFIHFRIVWNC